MDEVSALNLLPISAIEIPISCNTELPLLDPIVLNSHLHRYGAGMTGEERERRDL
jgi:hypothetical protein